MPSNKFFSEDNHQKTDPEQQGFKQMAFEALHCLHRSNESIHNGFYYILATIEFMQIFFYVTHPIFPYYRNSTIMNQIHKILKYAVFNEFLADDSDLYKFVIPICLGYIIAQIILTSLINKQIKQKKMVETLGKIHFTANLMFLIFNSVLTIPFFGISINVLYCNTSKNRYTLGQNCYKGSHLAYCFIAGFIIASILLQWGINWFIYYNKNPFGRDFLSKYENNALLGKFLIKIIPIVYMSIDLNMEYVYVFIFGLAGCFGGYLFFFRLFSYHDYNEKNFYFVLFLQVILAWFSLNNIILSYLDTERKAGGLFESFLCSLLVAILALQIQEQNYEKIFMQGMESDKIKKQNIEKFFYRLIYKFNYARTDEEKTQISTIVKILQSKLKETSLDQKSTNSIKINTKIQKKFYAFLSKFVLQYLQSNFNIMLMLVNCNLLILDQKFSYAFHQSLELSSKKINIVEQLMIYRFRRHQRYDKQKFDNNKKQNGNIFMMYYGFNQNLMKLQEQISSCTFNNFDYWEEVCELNPSIYKIRNLAKKYQNHQNLIDFYYSKISDIFPNNKIAIKTYIQFLMYVGININKLSKSKQRYLQAQENITKTRELQKKKGNLIQMGQNENLAFVSIQTCQMSLATITNCNTEFKKILGYEKHELIDKKVNKIMPKCYNQFHDSLVRGYIQKKQHNQKNKLQRVVHALSKDNYLIEVALFTKVNYQAIGEKPSLELIGFIKKIENFSKALIILEINSQNIVGANAGFLILIQHGILNTQFANSQIKICTLLPNLNINFIKQGKSQETSLVFSSSVIVTKSGFNFQIKKKVIIEVQQVKQYSGSKQKFAYLIVKQIESESEQNKQKTSAKFIRKQPKKLTRHDFQKEKSKERNKLTAFESQVSLMGQHSLENGTLDSQEKKNSQKEQKEYYENEDEAYHLIQRNKQQFLKNQHLDIFNYFLWLVLAFFLLTSIGLLIYQIVLGYRVINTSAQIKGQIKNSYIITYEIAQINKKIQKVIQKNSYNQSQLVDNSNQLARSISLFRQNLISMMNLSTNYDYPIELNQFRYYDIIINKSDRSKFAKQTIIDAFFQYLSSAKNYIYYSQDDFIYNFQQMKEENFFIQQNGKELFSKVAKKMSLQYLELDKYLFQSTLKKELIVTISYSVSVVLALLFISLLINKINTFNQSVVALYNQIRLWDATQMKNKCLKFIKDKSTGLLKTYSNKRCMSSLINIFPQETLIRILQSASKNDDLSKEKESRHNKHINSSSDDEQLLQGQYTQQGIEGQLNKVSDARQKKFYVLLTEKNKFKTKFILSSIITVFLILGIFFEHFFTAYQESILMQNNQKVSELGKVRNNLSFINYYTYMLMLNPQDQTFRRLLKTEIDQFYASTDSCYDIIGDPSTILKNSYNFVEQSYALIFAQLDIPKSQRYNVKNPKYLLQQWLFDSNIQKISQLLNNELQKITQDLSNNLKTTQLSFTLTYIFLNIFFILLIKFWMLEEILKNSKKSKSMVSMLPPWLIERNKGVFQILH